MSEFAVTVPQWNDIPQVCVNGAAQITDDGKISVPTSAGMMSITMLSYGVRIQLGEDRTHDYGMLKAEISAKAAQIEATEEQTKIQAGDHTLILSHRPFHFSLLKKQELVQSSGNDGHFVRQYRLPPLARVNEGWFMAFNLESSEPVYGLGEKWGKLDHRGQLIRSFNYDALGVNAEISYKNTPFAWSPNGWGVFVHTPAPVTHAVGYAPWSQRAYGVLVEDYSLDLFLMTEDTGAQMLDRYTELTGKAPVPPRWSLGVILSKAYYQDVPEILSTAEEVREKGMPCDVITLDGRAWQDTDTRFAFEWDPKRFDDPAALIKRLKDMNFKVCVWEYPLVSVQNPLFEYMAKKGWLIKDNRTGLAFRYQWDISAFGEVLTPLPQSGIVDFTHPEAYAFWRDKHKALFDVGVDMIKVDFGEQIEDPHMQAHNGEVGMALHNVYTLLYNRCVYEAAAMYSQNGPFLFSRSSWTGSQCYPSQWGGDPQADWGGLAGSIRGGLSWGMSGAPYYATDVGGFYKDTRDAALFVRWTQAGVFSAHMRLHGIGQREPWSYGPEAEQAATQALKMRYRLMPYIEKTVEQSSTTGMPVQRAMVLAFPDDKAAWAFEDQFMFGDDLLVAPCVNPNNKVSFYLPEGIWVDFQSGEELIGGKVYERTLTLDELAVYAKKGTSIPLGPEVEHTEALKQGNEITQWIA